MEQSEKLARLHEMIEPGPGRIAVMVEVKSERSPTGLFLPEGVVNSMHEARPTQGVVVAIGDPFEHEETKQPVSESGWAIGDRVIFGKYSGTTLEWQADPNDRSTKEKIVVLNDKDVLCRLVEPINVKVKI